MKLPNPDQAVINNNKLIGYCLNPNHSDGKHKTRVFKSALDIDLDHMEILKSALIDAVYNCDAIFNKENN